MKGPRLAVDRPAQVPRQVFEIYCRDPFRGGWWLEVKALRESGARKEGRALAARGFNVRIVLRKTIAVYPGKKVKAPR